MNRSDLFTAGSLSVKQLKALRHRLRREGEVENAARIQGIINAIFAKKRERNAQSKVDLTVKK